LLSSSSPFSFLILVGVSRSDASSSCKMSATEPERVWWNSHSQASHLELLDPLGSLQLLQLVIRGLGALSHLPLPCNSGRLLLVLGTLRCESQHHVETHCTHGAR
jgi:hypothetical protein